MTNKEKMRIIQLWGYNFVYRIDQDGDIEEVLKVIGPRIQYEFDDDSGIVNERIEFGYQRVYHRMLFTMTGWGMIKK